MPIVTRWLATGSSTDRHVHALRERVRDAVAARCKASAMPSHCS